MNVGSGFLLISFHLLAISLRLEAELAKARPSFSVAILKLRSGSPPNTLEKYTTPCFQQIFQGGSVKNSVHPRLEWMNNEGI